MEELTKTFNHDTLFNFFFFYRYFETLIHMLKASLGTGILAMPDAFHNAGYLVATIGTLVIGFLCTYTIHILVSIKVSFSLMALPLILASTHFCDFITDCC